MYFKNIYFISKTVISNLLKKKMLKIIFRRKNKTEIMKCINEQKNY